MPKKAAKKKTSRKAVKAAPRKPRPKNWTDPVTGHAFFPVAVEHNIVVAVQEINRAVHNCTRKSHEELWDFCKSVGMTTSEYQIVVDDLTKWMNDFYFGAQKGLDKALYSRFRKHMIANTTIKNAKTGKDVGSVEPDAVVMDNWLSWRGDMKKR